MVESIVDPARSVNSRELPTAQRCPHCPAPLRRGKLARFVRLADGCEHLALVSQRDAKLFQVLVRQMLQDRDANAVFDKALGALGRAV